MTKPTSSAISYCTITTKSSYPFTNNPCKNQRKSKTQSNESSPLVVQSNGIRAQIHRRPHRRIVSFPSQRITPHDSPRREHEPFLRTVFLIRLSRVFGTRRHEATTLRQRRGNLSLVKVQQTHRHAHRQRILVHSLTPLSPPPPPARLPLSLRAPRRRASALPSSPPPPRPDAVVHPRSPRPRVRALSHTACTPSAPRTSVASPVSLARSLARARV